jgi:hypothetical protein
MKKRLISMLLTVLMVASFVGGVSVSAYADSNYQTISYTVKSGDTLVQICNNNNLNWSTCEAAIDKLNNLSSSNYRFLTVGSVLKLPATNEDATKIMAATTTTTTTVTTTTNGVSNTVTTTSTSSNSASASASYWLISYTMQKGETVSGVCNSLGINFESYKDTIKTLNGISSWSKVSAGKTIYLPTTTAPATGTSCYAVMSHSVAKGETATAICKAYGTSYSAVQSLIGKLNPNANMNNIKAGSTLLVPVPTVITSTSSATTTTVASSGSVVSGTTGTTSTGTTSTGTSSTGTSGSSSSKTYKLSTGTVTDGSISFTVNGKTATTAAAGAKVHINVAPGSYKALSSLSLTRADGSKATTISDGVFTMPESDVTVSATFTSGHYIGTSSKGGTVLLTLNGVEVSHAVKGAKVKVDVTPKDGYEISGISVVNTSNGKVVAGDVKNGGTFTMPDTTVMVQVTYKTSATYKLNKVNIDLNGSYALKSGNTEISSTIAGTKILIDADPADGYKVGTITVTTVNSNKKVTVNDNYFTMPTDDVNVSVSFVEANEKEVFSITVASSTDGWATALNGTKSTATAGETVTVDLTAVAGFYPVKYTVKANGSTKTYEYDRDGVNTFAMPSGDVVVTPYFEAAVATVTDITTNDSTIGEIVVSTNGKQLAKQAAGGAVEIADNATVPVQGNLTATVTLKKAGYSVSSIKLYSSNDKVEPIELTSGKAVSIPANLADTNIWVDVQYEANSVKLGASTVDSNVEGVWVTRLSDNTQLEKDAPIYTGETLNIYAKGKTGYDVKVYAVYTDANNKSKTVEITEDDGYNFTVPACSKFAVKVVSSAAERKLVVSSPYNEGVITVQVGSGKAQNVTSEAITVKTGEKVIIKSLGNGVTVTSNYADADGNALKLTSSNSNKQYTFTMPAIDSKETITVYIDGGAVSE